MRGNDALIDAEGFSKWAALFCKKHSGLKVPHSDKHCSDR
jgi:hypothetical protein